MKMNFITEYKKKVEENIKYSSLIHYPSDSLSFDLMGGKYSPVATLSSPFPLLNMSILFKGPRYTRRGRFYVGGSTSLLLSSQFSL